MSGDDTSGAERHGWRGLFVFVESYPQVIAGQQRTLMALLGAAPADAPEALVVTPADGIFANRLRADGRHVEVWQQPLLLDRYSGAMYEDGLRGRTGVFRHVAAYVRRLRRELGRVRPAVVFCNDMRGLLTVGVAARLRGIPVMIWDKLDKPHGALDWLQLPLVRCNAVISRAVTSKYPAWQRRLLARRIHVVPNGVDIVAIEAADGAPSDLDLNGAEPVVGLVGTVTPRKGHDRLLAIWPRLHEVVPSAKLIFVGEPATDEDRRWATTLPNRDHPSIRWLGQRGDVPALMHAFDVLVVPSRHEGMGRVCAEAMAAGKPVLGARTGGIPEVVVDGETGLLFEPDDADDLLAKLVKLCTDEPLRRQLGEAGGRRARAHFDQRRQHQRIWELLLAL